MPSPPPLREVQLPYAAKMQRFEASLRWLWLEDDDAIVITAPVLRRFLDSARDLQCSLGYQNASVHVAVSRISPSPDEEAMTTISWISVYGRIGTFDIDDDNVCRLFDAALRNWWQKEEVHCLLAATGVAMHHLVASR